MNTRILQGDCLQTLATLDAGVVQTCATSPPYYGLRDYGTARWEGGSAECDHLQVIGGTRNSGRDRAATGGKFHDSPKIEPALGIPYRDICGKCGAIRIDSQIGLEQSPEAYVEKLVAVFREVRRVLKDDGTLWLNLGDSYAGSSKGQGGVLNSPKQRSNQGSYFGAPLKTNHMDGLKNKDLIGIPWMVAFALRADGWYLRSEIIWHKPNPMPESVTDRPTKSHEQIFLLSKSAQYYYDAEAIREENSPLTVEVHGYKQNSDRHKHADEFDHKGSLGINGNGREMNGRNKRDVWTVNSQPYKHAHFATFPPKLIEPCILAGSREGDTVLDPFNGSGTTGAVAIKHHRNYIGCELNPDYIELTNRRFSQVQPVLFGVT